MSLRHASKQVHRLIKSIPQKEVTIEGELLALHQSVAALWAVYRERKDLPEVEKKMANTFICSFLVAQKLNLKNLDNLFEKRIHEIRNAV